MTELNTLSVLQRISAERRRQIEELHRLPSDDDCFKKGQLAMAAAAYAVNVPKGGALSGSRLWPFHPKSFHPRSHEENLVRAAALLVAELERLHREKDT